MDRKGNEEIRHKTSLGKNIIRREKIKRYAHMNPLQQMKRDKKKFKVTRKTEKGKTLSVERR